MSGSWGTGVFSCLMDTSVCIDHWLCGPCQLSRQWKALEGQTNQFDMVMCVVACCVGQCLNVLIRMKTVEKYGISEGFPLIIVFGLCFGSCSSCQVHRELTVRNAWPGGTLLHKEPGKYTAMK